MLGAGQAINTLMFFCLLGVLAVDLMDNYKAISSTASLLFVAGSVGLGVYMQQSQIIFDFLICNVLSSLGFCLFLFSFFLGTFGNLNYTNQTYISSYCKLRSVIFHLYLVLFLTFVLQLEL